MGLNMLLSFASALVMGGIAITIMTGYAFLPSLARQALLACMIAAMMAWRYAAKVNDPVSMMYITGADIIMIQTTVRIYKAFRPPA